jgi:hypothetical protein
MCLGWSSSSSLLLLFLSLSHTFNRTTFQLPRILGDYIEKDEVGGAHSTNARDWQQPLVGQGLLIIEVSRSHSDTPHSVGLFRASDQAGLKTSTLQHTTLKIDGIHAPQRDSYPQCQQASGRSNMSDFADAGIG